MTYHPFVRVESALRRCLVAARLADVRLVAFVHRVIVRDQGSFLSGFVVAQFAREWLLVEVDHPVMHLERLVGLELLAARLTHVHFVSSMRILKVSGQLGLLQRHEVAQLALHLLSHRPKIIRIKVKPGWITKKE